ncbi:MAG: radical SAM protein [Chloroflexota bacterium]|nr:MAG: radical SAM protein [Bellilinea sp.]
MVHQGYWNNQSVTISVKPNCLTISVGSKEVFSYDLAGRLWTALLDEVSYRRGLDGKIVAKWLTPDKNRRRRWLSPKEAADLIQHGHLLLRALLEKLRNKEIMVNPPLDEKGWSDLEIAASFDIGSAEADVVKYHQVYKPVGILPPDQYISVVLQAAEGCSFNTCTFCDFYRDRPFRIKREDEFREHIRAVKTYLGKGLSLRRTIFLGDANALVIPMPRLISLLEVVHDELDVESLGGIFAFLDGFSGERKTPQDFARLAEMGLKRVYIGMESGHAPLLKFLRKPGTPQDVLQAVQNIKGGGVAVGIIVLLGAGGKTYEMDHVRDTIQLINTMPLDTNDLIYFSELVENENLPYVQTAFQHSLQPLSTEERIQQGEMIENNLIFNPKRGIPHISRYDIREFVY